MTDSQSVLVWISAVTAASASLGVRVGFLPGVLLGIGGRPPAYALLATGVMMGLAALGNTASVPLGLIAYRLVEDPAIVVVALRMADSPGVLACCLAVPYGWFLGTALRGLGQTSPKSPEPPGDDGS